VPEFPLVVPVGEFGLPCGVIVGVVVVPQVVPARKKIIDTTTVAPKGPASRRTPGNLQSLIGRVFIRGLS
jgi:hypothetical protein